MQNRIDLHGYILFIAYSICISQNLNENDSYLQTI